jgi:hypothetical protein
MLTVAVLASSHGADASPKKVPPKKTATATPPAPPPRRIDVRVVERIDTITADYQAEVFSGVPLTDPYAKERGLDHGLVWMAFTNTRQLSFRMPKEKIRRIVRMVVDDEPARAASFAPKRVFAVDFRVTTASSGNTAADMRDRVDVLDTTDGTVVVMTSTGNAGIFTTSDVYAFPKTNVEGEVAFAEKAPALYRERLKDALALSRSSAK